MGEVPLYRGILTGACVFGCAAPRRRIWQNLSGAPFNGRGVMFDPKEVTGPSMQPSVGA